MDKDKLLAALNAMQKDTARYRLERSWDEAR